MYKYTTTKDVHNTSVFALDVHARSISLSGLDYQTGEMFTQRFTNCPAADDIAAWIKGKATPPYYVAYESGCTGFALSRGLRELGIDCDVIAVSSIARSTDDKQRKNDKTDARRLLSELTNELSSYSVVWTPDIETEAARDIARCRIDCVNATKRARQQLSAFLLRKGYVFNEKTPTGKPVTTWGKRHMQWIKDLKFTEETDEKTLNIYLRMVDECMEQQKAISKVIMELSQKPRFRPYVDALCLLQGIDVQTAFLATCTFGEFSRFKNGRSVSKWLGTTPRESSSGESIMRGSITKAGDTHLRQGLIEGAAAISLRVNFKKFPRKGSEIAAEISDICHKANIRVKERFDHLRNDNMLHSNKARVAVINELIKWIWVIGVSVEEELGMQK